MNLFVGIDVGTSACRACAVNADADIVAEARTELPAPHRDGSRVEQDAGIWWRCLTLTVDALNRRIDPSAVKRIAIDATSGTLLLCDRSGRPLTPGLMYNDARAVDEAAIISRVAPPDNAVSGASSGLAKLLHLSRRLGAGGWLAAHQADWLTGKLTGRFGISDENNALKSGYDPRERCWPAWLQQLQLPAQCLPRVVPVATLIASLDPAVARSWGWPDSVEVVAGTTDSTAGFIATGADRTGTAVTALGSTLVLKVLSDTPVFAAQHGIYSHRLGDRWLVGGASNAGGAVLAQHFSACDIRRFSRLVDPSQLTGLNYYPLPAPGERFPVYDPQLQPGLEPRPALDREFFQGILEGLARIEQRGYRLLSELGAPWPERVISVGGGARNQAWVQIRQQMLGVPVSAAQHQEAAYGAALLALRR